ncbi:hypothetical protein JMJ77_0004061, partial [Colletotrichum scovillei]
SSQRLPSPVLLEPPRWYSTDVLSCCSHPVETKSWTVTKVSSSINSADSRMILPHGQWIWFYTPA